MRGKKTDIETKAKIANLRINKWMLWSDIAEELDMPERTVNKILDTDIAEFLKNNPDKAEIYEKNKLGIKVKDIDNLNIDIDILKEYLSFVWGYKEAKEFIEWFMLQSLWKSYIRRKSLNKNTRYSILERAWFKCQACWVSPNKDNNTTLEIDHIIPHSMWWLSVENNYQVLCMKCNVSKWNRFIHNHNEYEG